MTKGHRMPVASCTACDKTIDGATEIGAGNVKPNPGDISVCLYCGHLMIFGTDQRPRDPTSDEMHDLAGDPRILAVQRARGRM